MEYLVGALELFFVWLILFLARKDLRKIMFIFSSIFALTSLLDPIFVPHYWNPPSILKISFFEWYCYLESIIYSFSTGGIAFAVYKVIANKRLEKIKPDEISIPLKTLFYNSCAVAIFLVGSNFLFKNWMFSAILTLSTGTVIIALSRKDLLKSMILSGLCLAGIHTAVFFLTYKILFPGFVAGVWNDQGISGILFWGIPLEEIMFPWIFGTTVSGIYEFSWGYKLN